MLRREYSKQTIKSYISCIEKFFEYIGKDSGRISNEDINDYVEYLIFTRKLSGSYHNQFLNAYVFYCKLHHPKNKLTFNQRPRKSEFLPEVLGEDEIRMVINSIKNVKHKAIIAFSGEKEHKKYVLKKKSLNWVLKNKIEGFNTSSRYFVLSENDKIIVNHEYKGVFKLKVDTAFKKVISLEKDTTVKKGIHSSLVKYNNDILYASKDGVFKYEKNKNRFEKNLTLARHNSVDWNLNI